MCDVHTHCGYLLIAGRGHRFSIHYACNERAALANGGTPFVTVCTTATSIRWMANCCTSMRLASLGVTGADIAHA